MLVVAAHAEEVQPSHLQAAGPFLLTAIVLLVGATLSLLVIARARAEYEAILCEAGVLAQDRTIALRPESLAEMANWLIDSGGMFASLVGPLIGLALLYERFSEAVIVLYSCVILLSIGGFALFVSRVSPRGYPNRPIGLQVAGRIIGPRPVWIFTPVVLIAASVNIVAGVGVYIFGP
jgi:hypothetical protein